MKRGENFFIIIFSFVLQIQELQRFIPKLVEIAAPGRTFYGDGTAAENIQSASTLHDALIALKLNTVVAD